MFILSPREIEDLLRPHGADEILLRSRILVPMRDTVRDYLRTDHGTIRALACDLRLSERRLGEFVGGALPNAAEWLAISRWTLGRPQVASGAGSIAADVLTAPAPRRKIYLVRGNLLRAIRAAYEDAGCRYPARELDLW